MKKVHKSFLDALLILLIFLLPFQTRYFLFSQEVNGGFFEYGSFFLYAFDFIFIIFLFTFFIRHFSKLNTVLFKNKWFIIFLALFELSLIISIFLAYDHWLAFYGYLRIVMGMLLALIISVSFFQKEKLLFALGLSSIIPACFGIWQFFSQKVHESTFLGMAQQIPNTLGVSVIEMGGERILRAYGTFPHPNILGGFLVISLFSLLSVLETAKTQKIKIIIYSALLIESIALFFTFSRLAWIVFLILISVWVYRQCKKRCSFKEICRPVFSTLGILLFLSLLYIPLVQTRFGFTERIEQQSIQARISQYDDALSLIQTTPFLGVGAFNYAWGIFHEIDSGREVWDYQPVHNLYVLSLVELGIFGLLTYLILLGFVFFHSFKRFDTRFFLFGGVLILGLLDHYLWTNASMIYVFYLILGLNISADEV